MKIVRDVDIEELKRLYEMAVCTPSPKRYKAYNLTGINSSTPIYSKNDLIFEDLVIKKGTKCYYDIYHHSNDDLCSNTLLVIACQHDTEDVHAYNEYDYIITDKDFLINNFITKTP